MRHHNSVFHALLKQVPWDAFDRLVDAHGADARVRRLSTKDQFIALLYGQLAGATSLRAIETGLASHAARLYHLGAKPARRATLADANAGRPAAVFAELFAQMVARAGRGTRRALGEAVYLIDATTLRLTGSSGWARFSSHADRGGVFSAKAHVIYDADAERPIYAAITPGRVNDIIPAKAMPIEAGATYVFDLAYYDYAWWAELDARGCRIVTRFKSNTRLIDARDHPGLHPASVLSDRVGLLPARQARNRKNPFANPVREVRVKTETGKTLRLLTNDLDAPAADIAALYKRRWAIELFFRWVKQTLRIRHFLGASENAVRIQIAVALIAYLILRLAQAGQSVVKSPLAFARLVRSNLMHRKRIDRLLDPGPPRPPDTRQMALSWE